MFPFEQRLTYEEKQELLMKYPTIDFAYLILYFESEFKKRGYVVSTKKEDVLFVLPDGRRKMFDIYLDKELNPFGVDVDMGTKSKEDSFDILDKAYELSEDIYIATKDKRTLYLNTKPNCFKWIRERLGGFEKAEGKVTFHFTTLEWLIVNEKAWEDVSI